MGGGGGGEGAAAGLCDTAASYSSRDCALHNGGREVLCTQTTLSRVPKGWAVQTHTPDVTALKALGNPQRGFKERGLVVRCVFAQIPLAPWLYRGEAGGGLQIAPPPCVPWGLFLSRTESEVKYKPP